MTDKKETIAIIDGDSISYIVGYNNQATPPDTPQIVTQQVNEYMEKILKDCGASHYCGFLGASGYTFRHLMTIQGAFGEGPSDKLYKGNRGAKGESWERQWAAVINGHLVHKWGFATVPFYIESDDAVCIMAHELKAEGRDYVVVSNDKDLQQIEGKHYSYRTGKQVTVTQDEALYLKYKQVLMGDATDNIVGIPKTGPKTAEKILAGANTPAAYKYVALQAYINHYGERIGILKFAENANLISLLDSRDQMPDDVRQMFTSNIMTSTTLYDELFK